MLGLVAFLVPSLCVALLGAWLVVTGWRGRRVEGVVECAKCRFELRGIDLHGACPECGQALSATGASRIRRARRPVRVAIGTAVFVLGAYPIAMLGWLAASQVSLVQLAPVWWLRTELAFVGPARAAEIGAELDLRLCGGQRGMTTAEAQAVAGDFSRMLADPAIAWNPGFSNFYERARTQTLVGDADWMRYVERATQISWSPRTRVRAGNVLPVELVIQGATVADALPISMIRLRSRVEGVSIDGRDLPGTWGGESGTSITRGGHSGWTMGLPMPDAVGKARLTMRYRVDVVTADAEERLIGSFVRDFEGEIEIVGSEEPALRVVRDESLAAAIASALSVNRLELTDRRHVDLMIQVRNAPADLGFEVLLRPRDGVHAGREIALGSIWFASGATSGYGIGRDIRDLGGTDATAVDVVLRPSVAAAERSPRLESVWMGADIVIEKPSLRRQFTAPDDGATQGPTQGATPGATQPEPNESSIGGHDARRRDRKQDLTEPPP